MTGLEVPGPRAGSISSAVISPVHPSSYRVDGIALVDKTNTEVAEGDFTPENLSRLSIDEDRLAEGFVPSEAGLSRRWTNSSLRHSIAQRKYAKYQENTFVDHQNQIDRVDSLNKKKKKHQKGKHIVGNIFHRRKKFRESREEGAVIEVLYENQRGFFLLGFPHFSSKGLLNFDPAGWTNAEKSESPVNITNAQLPDPDWVWAWKTWYVDMSRDVDENGWEYSFAFSGCAWHGNHPWFHSFVRRRRWLRKRVRKLAGHQRGYSTVSKRSFEGHMMSDEYFTIHPSKNIPEDIISSAVSTTGRGWREVLAVDEDVSLATGGSSEVKDIASLLLLLRKATIDREKISIVRNFIDHADEELYYLTEEMPHIMSLLMFQNSRRDLLKVLMDELDKASDLRQVHTEQHKVEGTMEGKRIDNLIRARDAAEVEVKRLEYWSDIRRMAREGATLTAEDEEHWPHGQWQGLDNSGPRLKSLIPSQNVSVGDSKSDTSDGTTSHNKEGITQPNFETL